MKLLNTQLLTVDALRQARRTRQLSTAVRAVMEPVEGRQMLSVAPTDVASMILYDGATGRTIQTLDDGDTLDLAKLGGSKLNVKAVTDEKTGSVIFGLNGNDRFRVENYAVYAMMGDSGEWNPSTGNHTLTATAYTGIRGSGEIEDSHTVTIKVIDSGAASTVNTKPAAPSLLVAHDLGSDEVQMSWGSFDGLADGFNVYRSTNNGTTWTKIDIVDGNQRAFTDTSVSGNTTYSYRISAFNDAGVSGYSNTAKVTTSSTPLVPPPIDNVNVGTGVQPTKFNTGVQVDKSRLKVVDGFKAQSNTVYENLYVTGLIDCRWVKNVVIKNCIIDGGRSSSDIGSQWGIRADEAVSLTVQNCEIKNVWSAAIYGENFKAINNYVHHTGGDGFKPSSNVLIQGNYVTQLGWLAPDAHSDGVQIRGGHDITIVGNFFDMPEDAVGFKSNAALFTQGFNDGVYNVTFKDNWARGGNFTIRAFSDGGDASSIRIIGNYLYAGDAKYGFGRNEDGVIWEDNTVFGTTKEALPWMK